VAVLGRAAEVLREAVARVGPDAVVCFGQADGRSRISVERVALNLDDAASADNEGVVSAQPIRPDGPPAYWSTLPVEAIVEALRAEGIPAATSRDAGGYLCNHVFYSLLDLDLGIPAASSICRCSPSRRSRQTHRRCRSRRRSAPRGSLSR
jgi:pyroglutamyl-peptidase